MAGARCSIPHRASLPCRSRKGTSGHGWRQELHSSGQSRRTSRSGNAVSNLVARFNWESMLALQPGHDGGPAPIYVSGERERILAKARREPEREKDGTAEWSLITLRWALRRAPDGLPEVSTYTIWKVLREEGFSWQRSRSCCETGKVKRKPRKSGEVVEVTDPDQRLRYSIEQAYRESEKLLGLSVWGVDQADPY